MRGKLSGFLLFSLVWALCVCAWPQRAHAQEGTVVQTRPEDLSITARVTADSLVFRSVPEPKVEFTGRPRRETVWDSERTNLPEQVQPGVTYRNIGITLRITSVFADIDRIVAEALGEIPVSDDAPPQSSPPAPPGQTQPAPPAETRTVPPADGAARSFVPTSSVRGRDGAVARRRVTARKGRRL
jgi:hypothetical protein